VSAMPDHYGDVDDDTTDFGQPGYYHGDFDQPQRKQRDRLRPSPTVRRLHGVIVSVCYIVSLGSAAWLTVQAILHTAVLIMLFSVGLLAWLLPGVPRLLGWVRAGQDTGEAVPVPWQAQLVTGLLTALNLFLFIYARL
jgi:hypothetical protein